MKETSAMGEVATVYIVDDDNGVREALGLLLRTEGYAVRLFESASAFLKGVREDSTGCIVTDVRMPGMSGIELMEALRERRAIMPIILITAHANVPLAVQAMKLGAVDVLEKPFDDALLLSAIENALTQNTDNEQRHARALAVRARMNMLSKRENEVLAGLLKGKPNKAIANDLGISARTVEVHRAAVMAKMQARSLPELVQMVMLVTKDG